MSDVRVPDISALEEDDPEQETNTQGAPLIQISHLHVKSGSRTAGTDNLGYENEQDSDDASIYSISRPVSPVSSGTSTQQRRYSCLDTVQPSGGLTVPDSAKVRRRQSMGSETRTLSPPPPPEGPDGDATRDLWRRENVGMETLGVDHLTRSQGIKSPGCRSVHSMRSEWSELARLERSDSIGSYHSVESEHEGDTSFSGVSSQMSAQLKNLVRRFSNRVERFKEKAIQPPTPSSTASLDKSEAISVISKDELEPPGRQLRLDSYVPLSRASGNDVTEWYIGQGRCRFKVPAFFKKCRRPGTIDPTSWMYVSWLFILSMAYLYNAASIPLRAAFKTARFYHPDLVYKNETTEVCYNTTCVNETKLVATYVTRYYSGCVTPENQIYWWILDYLADLLYLIDILLIKNRVRFVNNGLFEKEWKACLKNYIAQIDFKLDLLSLTPLDLLYFIPQIKYSPLVRWPRILKIKTFWEFYDRVDHMVKSAHFIRVARTFTYMMYLIHLEACGYYAMSAYEGLGKNGWVYSGHGIAYIRCMYLATKTATSIGNNPKPVNTLEYVFMTFYWLSGVFVFAMLIGQIRDIFQAAGLAQETYRKTMDQTLSYMKSLNLPKEIQDKVRMWFTYNWQTSKTLDENSLLDPLPKKMRADLAIHVHYNTLSKVALFQNTDKNLLFDLVLKLKPCLYLPGNYICRKGEVGTEMYIVMSGQVEVVGGENNSIVFATLHEGSVFGEISLLALAGGNRRTADVRSKGYSQLFILSKNDFEEAMREYPEAAKILKHRAKKLLAQNAKHAKKSEEDKMETEEVIKSREETPKLVKTVIQVIDPDSNIHRYLNASSQDRPQSKHSATSRTSHGATLPDEQTSPELMEDDEILVIEQTERKLTPEEVRQLKDNMENWPTEKPAEDPQVDAAASVKRNEPDRPIINIGNNKVSPATITYEDDSGNAPSKNAANSDEKLAGKSTKSAVRGGKDVKEALNKRMASAAKTGSSVHLRSNKVVPSGELPGTNDNRHDQKSDGCVMTCEVEIHRCKTTTPSTRRVGSSDSLTGVGVTSDNVTSDALSDRVFSPSESGLVIEAEEKNDETKV